MTAQAQRKEQKSINDSFDEDRKRFEVEYNQNEQGEWSWKFKEQRPMFATMMKAMRKKVVQMAIIHKNFKDEESKVQQSTISI